MTTERIRLLEDVRWLVTELSKTETGKRSKNKVVLDRAVAEVSRQYGKDMAKAAREYLLVTR